MTPPLNAAQSAAVRALSGPVLIRAGAGSGKTRTLAERFTHALADAPEESWRAAGAGEVLAITFTEKAAGELKGRVRAALRAAGRGGEMSALNGAWISTIHGLCARLLRRFAFEAAVDPSFSVLDEFDAFGLKEASFERAARAALSTDDGRALFGAFDYDAVFAAVESLAVTLRSRGLGIGALRLAPPEDARTVHAEALALFEVAGERVRACGGVTEGSRALAERCDAVVAELVELDVERLAAADLAHATWSALSKWAPPRSTKATANLREEITESHARLLARAARGAAEPLDRAIVDITRGYLRAYDRAKRERGALDFHDLQERLDDVLSRHEGVRRDCANLFRLVMVDEFQDTDALQLRIVTSLAGDDLCTVGDEKQAIYRFRGADVDVYRAHNERMLANGARSFSLSENYRSHPAILAFINELFSSDVLFGSGLLRLKPGRVEIPDPILPDGDPRVELIIIDRKGSAEGSARRLEADAIAERFLNLTETGFRPDDMVVLLRSCSHAEDYAAAMRARGFDVAIVGGSRFLSSPEIKAARALVAAIANPYDEIALTRVLASDIGRVSDDGLWLLLNGGATEFGRGGLWHTLDDPPPTLSEHDSERASAVRSIIEFARGGLGHVPIHRILLQAIEASGWGLVMLSGGEPGHQAYANVAKLVREAGRYEANGGAGMAGFASHLDARERCGDHAPPAVTGRSGAGVIRIMSVHAAKGLEFPVVAAAGLGATPPGDPAILRARAIGSEAVELSVRLPSTPSARAAAERPTLFSEIDSTAKAAELEEAKRVFYVACTRARELLILSGAANLARAPSEEGGAPLAWIRNAAPSLFGGVDDAGGPVAEVRKFGDASVRVTTVPLGDCEPPKVMGTAGEPLPPPERESAKMLAGDMATRRVSDPLRAPRRLSYSDIALYLSCPLRFHAERVLRIGRLETPDADASLRFGSAAHAALQLEGVGGADSGRLRAIARGFGLDDGYHERLVGAVAAYRTSDAAAELAEMSMVRREWSFAVEVETDDGPVDLVGALDAYGREGTTGLIIDYKTGALESPSGGDRERWGLQARCYALAAFRDGCERVSVRFVEVERPDEGGRPTETLFTFGAHDAACIEDEVRAVHRMISADGYPPRDRWDPGLCGVCAVPCGICPHPKRPSPASCGR